MISQKIPNEERNSQSMSRVLEETSSKAHHEETQVHEILVEAMVVSKTL